MIVGSFSHWWERYADESNLFYQDRVELFGVPEIAKTCAKEAWFNRQYHHENEIATLKKQLKSAKVLISLVKSYRKCRCTQDQRMFDDETRVCLYCNLSEWLENNKIGNLWNIE